MVGQLNGPMQASNQALFVLKRGEGERTNKNKTTGNSLKRATLWSQKSLDSVSGVSLADLFFENRGLSFPEMLINMCTIFTKGPLPPLYVRIFANFFSFHHVNPVVIFVDK